jgi:hypothetical protein
MKIKHALVIGISTALLMACNEEKGPPAVADYFNPVVNGEAMSTMAYQHKYCNSMQPGFTDLQMHCRYVRLAQMYSTYGPVDDISRAKLAADIQRDKGQK